MTRREPDPVDESGPPPEIRGGNRPEDYTPPVHPSRRNGQYPGGVIPATEPMDMEEAFDDEPPGGNDPDAQ
jgi:hypothetical protein